MSYLGRVTFLCERVAEWSETFTLRENDRIVGTAVVWWESLIGWDARGSGKFLSGQDVHGSGELSSAEDDNGLGESFIGRDISGSGKLSIGRDVCGSGESSFGQDGHDTSEPRVNRGSFLGRVPILCKFHQISWSLTFRLSLLDVDGVRKKGASKILVFLGQKPVTIRWNLPSLASLGPRSPPIHSVSRLVVSRLIFVLFCSVLLSRAFTQLMRVIFHDIFYVGACVGVSFIAFQEHGIAQHGLTGGAMGHHPESERDVPANQVRAVSCSVSKAG